MPGGDRTEPLGAGPMSGRGAGFCRGYARAGRADPAPWQGQGRGFGGGRGWRRGGAGGRGWRHRFFAAGVPGRARDERWSQQPAAGDEQEWLATRARQLEGELEEVRARLAGLEKAGAWRKGEAGTAS
jgi:hypothetical protein